MEETEDALLLSSGGVRLRVTKTTPFQMFFETQDGSPLTGPASGQIGLMEVRGEQSHLMQRLSLGINFDCFWMKERQWVNFSWDEKAFPEPTAMLTRLKARGLKICVWINPYISGLSAMFDEGAAGGYFLKRTDGSPYQVDLWQPDMAIVDFTNPQAVQALGGARAVLVAQPPARVAFLPGSVALR